MAVSASPLHKSGFVDEPIDAYDASTPIVQVERDIVGPTSTEDRIQHEITHIPYRAWCEECVRARAKTRRVGW